MHRDTPTIETYTEFDRAYRHFNATLFQDALPPCVITLQRRKKTYGYFAGGSWIDAQGQDVTDEIALNPDWFLNRDTEDILSTLVHEMCHLQQHHFGKPGRGTYHHNKEWAKLMDAVGLVASETGKPGGKATGRRISHYIRAGGAFDQSCTALLPTGFIIPWLAKTTAHAESEDDPAGIAQKQKLASKTKYTCAACGLNAWAKPDARLVCGTCSRALTATATA